MIRPLHLGYGSIAIATLTLAVSFANVGFLWGIGLALFVGAAWAVSVWRSWGMGKTVSLFCIILGISMVAVQTESARVSLLISALAALAAWDLISFAQVLQDFEQIIAEEELIRAHLLRLFSLLIVGLALPLIAFMLQFELRFWQAFLLGVILLVGLSQVFSQFKRSSG
jgi:hypothetical protein